MSTISNVGKIAYIYDAASDTWHPVAGMTDTSANFSWTGQHVFDQEVVINSSTEIIGSLLVKGANNYFGSEAQRDAAIASPVDGNFALVFSNGSVQPQYYINGEWRVVGSNAFMANKTGSHTLEVLDAGKTLDFNVSSTATVTIPTNTNFPVPLGTQIAFIQSGTGQISFAGQAAGSETVTINSKNGNKKTATRYTQAILVKKDLNVWYLFGDLTA
jgi:hypothetical protein